MKKAASSKKEAGEPSLCFPFASPLLPGCVLMFDIKEGNLLA